MTVTEIVSQINARDERGLSAVFEQYGGALNGVILRIVGDERVAEEVLQDTLLKVWNKIGLYRPEQAGLFTWIMGIARNAAIDQVRLRGFQRNQQSEPFDVHVHAPDGAEVSSAAVDVATLTASLEPKYLDVLEKVYLQGYSTRAAAEELDIPVGTVKTRLRTAIRLLRDNIKPEQKLFLGSFLFTLVVLFSLWIFR